MDPISLDGEWQLFHFPEEKQAFSPADLLSAGLNGIPAQVPGNVELDLVRAGELPEPYYADNITRLRPLETHEWWYTRVFHLPSIQSGPRWTLVFEGLDTLATVWLNEIQVGEADNMLVEQRFEVSQALRSGENRLTVRLGSVLNQARRYAYDAVMLSWEQREEGLFIRKAPHVWGWDILPRAVSAGIWRSVRLEPVPEAAIEQLYYHISEATPASGLADSHALLGVRFQFRTPERELDDFEICFHGICAAGGEKPHTFDFRWPVEFIAGGCSIPIPGARLWWPKGYGEPCLYTVTAQLLQHGQVLAERADRIGIRKLVVDRTELAGKPRSLEPAGTDLARMDVPADPESHFVFYINNEAIQIRGTNWVPLDAFHSQDASRLEQAMALVNDLGCNMIRCWGGNVYESGRFFDLCDESGILVWQDFAFACNRYPQTEGFLARVRSEAEVVVGRLRNHPSLAIWCGDNEIDMAYLSQGLSPERNRLTREVLPGVLHRLDPFRAYVPSSPYTPPAVFQQPDPWRATPEQHLWGPRNYFKSPFYLQHSAHFIGEIGYHGCPAVESVRKFISPEHVWPWQNNDEWMLHSVYHWSLHPDGGRVIQRDRIRLMANQIQELFGHLPNDLETFVLASQISQAEAKKFFIESTRARKWATSGVLWWNVLDGWPQFSDAVVDYYFTKKLAYHYIRRAQRPALVMLGEPGASSCLPVIACNDTRQAAELRYRVWDANTGETAAQGTVELPPNQTWQVARIPTYASEQRMYLIEWECGAKNLRGGEHFGNHHLVGSPPFSLECYRGWLEKIAALPHGFDLTSGWPASG